MNRNELLSTYTAEQLADKYLRLQERFNRYEAVIKGVVDELPEELREGTEFHLEIDRLQSEVEKYRKAFEDAKKERDCQIAEYQKKIGDLEHDLKIAGEKIQDLAGENMKLQIERNDYKTKSEFLEVERMRVKQNEFADFLPTEPIKVADMLINAEGEYEHNPLVKKICGNDKGRYRMFDISELRQIAEHLLVYCNYNGEVEE